MINLLIVDDEKLIREGLKILLSLYEEINIIGLCSHGEEALELCKTNEVHVILMDMRMPVCNGVDGTKLIKALNKDIKILILTTFKDDEYIYSALSEGASGYLLKDSSSDIIYDAIKSAYSGNVVVHPEIAHKIIENKEPKESKEAKPSLEELSKNFSLSIKEIDIIMLVAEGLSNKEISEKLHLAQGTVKNNISTILSKLYLRDRTQLAIFAYKNNLVN